MTLNIRKLPWSAPQSKDGKYHRTCDLPDGFWEEWEDDKVFLKRLGLSPFKTDDGEWKLSIWTETHDIENHFPAKKRTRRRFILSNSSSIKSDAKKRSSARSSTTQKCEKCGQVYPLTRANFGQTTQKSGNVNWRKVCRACMRKNTAEHYTKTPEKAAQRVAKRQAQASNAEGSYSTQDIERIRAELDDKCRYCKTPLKGSGRIF